MSMSHPEWPDRLQKNPAAKFTPQWRDALSARHPNDLKRHPMRGADTFTEGLFTLKKLDLAHAAAGVEQMLESVDAFCLRHGFP
jgi:hypothetical protein